LTNRWNTARPSPLSFGGCRAPKAQPPGPTDGEEYQIAFFRDNTLLPEGARVGGARRLVRIKRGSMIFSALHLRTPHFGMR
jgi:hypothetical protein